MNRLVLFTRRLRHHLHARVQNFIACHHQLGIAAAKQLGEHLAEMLIDGVERALQQLAGFAIDLDNRVLQGVDRLVEIGHLGIEKGLALARSREFFQSGQVHRAQRIDLALELIDAALQAAELDAAFFDALGQQGHIGVGIQ